MFLGSEYTKKVFRKFVNFENILTANTILNLSEFRAGAQRCCTTQGVRFRNLNMIFVGDFDPNKSLLTEHTNEQSGWHSRNVAWILFTVTSVHSLCALLRSISTLDIQRFQLLHGAETSASVFRIKQNVFWILWSGKEGFQIMRINNFQGDLTDISANTKPLADTGVVCAHESTIERLMLTITVDVHSCITYR